MTCSIYPPDDLDDVAILPPSKKPKELTVEEHFIAEMKVAFPTAQVHKYEIRRGEPDRLCLLPGGRAVFVELKRPDGEPRPEQRRALQRLSDLGFEATWADTKDKVDALIARLKAENPGPTILHPCPECGAGMMLLRSLHAKICTDCEKAYTWDLKPGQMPLIKYQR